MLDTLIINGTVVDGTKAPRYRADIGLVGDRIQRIGDLKGQPAQMTVDATDRVICPGFIDVHNHSDGWLTTIPHLLPKTTQGFTTEILMADGISYAPVDPFTKRQWIYYLKALNGMQLQTYSGWRSMADYMQLLHRRCAQNVAAHVPYGNVRSMACGFGHEVPDDLQMEEITAGIRRGMAAGAVGLSTGLDYIGHSFATTDELAEACAAMAPQHGVYVTHVRYKKGTLAGVQEAVEIGRRAGVPVHISHLKANTVQDTDALLTYIDQVAVNEVDFSFDIYPYLPGSTMLNFFLPYEVWVDGPLNVLGKLDDPQVRERFGRALEQIDLDRVKLAWLGTGETRFLGKSVREYVTAVGGPAEDALADLLIEHNLAVLMVTHHGDDKLVHPFLAHEKYMMGSDGIYFPDGIVHPRVYGSAPRLLGPCVRDHKLFSLEEAVYKLSSFAATKFGLEDRGSLVEGHYADLVVFDAANIKDRATFLEPHQFSDGVEHLFVNGTAIIADGAKVDNAGSEWPGRFLKFNRR